METNQNELEKSRHTDSRNSPLLSVLTFLLISFLLFGHLFFTQLKVKKEFSEYINADFLFLSRNGD